MLMVLDRRDLTVRLNDGVIQVYKQKDLLQRAAVNVLELVVVYGNPLVESSVWRSLAQAGVPAVILASRGRQTTALLGQGLCTQLPARRLQYRCAEDEAQALAVARWFLARKFLGYRLPLQLMWEEGDPVEAQSVERVLMGSLINLHQSDSVASMMGIEGQLSRAWFQGLAASLPPEWHFSGRNRRPPRDPLNALLSLGYTLVLADVRQMLLAEGFDPAFGFLHQPYPGREALALDVLEIFRSGVDLFALKMMNILRPDQFYYHPEQGCRLNKDSRPIFYKEWAYYRDSWPRPLAGYQRDEVVFSPLREQVRGQLQELRRLMEVIQDAPS